MAERDYYEVLHVHPNADPGAILRSYWHLTRKYRVSMGSNPSAERAIEELDQAFDVLECAESRAAYDKQRTASAKASGAAKRVSIEFSFWELPAWEGIVAAVCVAALAGVALRAGAQLFLVLPPAVLAISAALFALWRSAFRPNTFGHRRWQRELSAEGLRSSTSAIIRRWREEHEAPDRAASLIEIMSTAEFAERRATRDEDA